MTLSRLVAIVTACSAISVASALYVRHADRRLKEKP